MIPTILSILCMTSQKRLPLFLSRMVHLQRSETSEIFSKIKKWEVTPNDDLPLLTISNLVSSRLGPCTRRGSGCSTTPGRWTHCCWCSAIGGCRSSLNLAERRLPQRMTDHCRAEPRLPGQCRRSRCQELSG